MSWQDDLRDWGLQRSASPPSPAEVEAFVRRARQHRRQASVRRVGLSVGLAMAALAVFWLMLPLESPPGWTWTPTVPVPVASLPPLSPGTHRIADDQLIVADDSAVLALSTGPTTRLQLDRGQVDAQVAPRAAGESFTITTGDYAVRVIGTRFTVQHSPFEVRVREGVVSVERPADDRRWQVGAGEWFADGQLHRRVKQRPPPSPPLADLQQLVLDGRFDEARPLLERRLTDDPADVSSWRLLARLETRAGRTDAAVDALLHHRDGGRRQQGRHHRPPDHVPCPKPAQGHAASNRSRTARRRIPKSSVPPDR